MPKQKWYYQNPKKAVMSFLFVATLSIFLFAEIILRISGYQPGLLAKDGNFNKVNQVELLKGYMADSNGIMKFSAAGRAFVTEQLDPNNNISILEKIMFHTSDFVGDITSLIDDFDELNKQVLNNDFQQFILKLKQKSPAELTDDEKAYLNYCHRPVNTDGFRSIEFKKYNTSKKSILLIGDSFTSGSDPTHITNSFADILAVNNYVVYNSGISGTDPAQYLAVAKTYIPKLKPDFVCVNFFIGNDIVNFKREAQPFQLAYYPTNAGNLMVFPDGFYLDSPEFAYDYILKQVSIPNQDISIFNRLLATTAIGTKFWILLRKFEIVKFQTDSKVAALVEQFNPQVSHFPVSEEYMKEIKSICEANSVQFILAIIPEVKELDRKIPDDYEGLFNELEIYVAPVNKEDYSANEHFNTKGNKKYADLILDILTKNKNKKVYKNYEVKVPALLEKSDYYNNTDD